jgi:hypothetical protein
MKAYNLSKESWHFRLANFGARRIYPEDGSDICEYIRAMVGGTFLLALSIAGAILGASWVGFSVYNLYEIAIGAGVLEIYTALLLFLLGALALFISVAVVVDWFHNRPDKPEVEPGFAKLAYRKFKNKTCFRLDFN